MKKVFLACGLFSTLVCANSEVSVDLGKKDYSNSKTKDKGKIFGFGIKNKNDFGIFSINYTKDLVDRKNFVTNTDITKLEVKKYNINYQNSITKDIDTKINYIKISDNLAPTDDGKIYGIGAKYKITNSIFTNVDYYRSDYKDFDVNQYDISLSKMFKFDEVKFKGAILAKSINIDGDKYGSYTFKDKDYFVYGFSINSEYNSYIIGFNTLFGKRIFTVLADGTKVQHHAMEQDDTYNFILGKKFDKVNIFLKYSYQNGKELPENRDDVTTKTTSLSISYKF